MLTRGQQAALLRAQITERLLSRQGLLSEPPKGGWIRNIRRSLGMTAAQLGKRLGIAQSSVTRLEQSEDERTISLETLDRAARALDCMVVYALVPRRSLDELVRGQATKVVKGNRQATKDTMALEGESVWRRDLMAVGGQALVDDLIAKLPSSLWDEDE